jgi:hypothetical protein
MDRTSPSRDELTIEQALAIHKATREKVSDRLSQTDSIIKSRELQQTLHAYRAAVNHDFGVSLSQIEVPKDALHKRDFGKRLEHVQDAQWYSSAERMRAHELEQHYHHALEGVALPHGEILNCLDVGSRSNFFGALMDYRSRHEPKQRNERWAMVDIDEPKLPARVNADNKRFKQIEPFGDITLPQGAHERANIITLNCVLHHVAESPDGQFNDAQIGPFIDKVYAALSDDGLVVVTEDFIGKDKPSYPYNNLIKDMDDLFYPNGRGNQKPSKEWIALFEKHGFKLEKESYPIGFNVIGLPVIETSLVLRKVTN